MCVRLIVVIAYFVGCWDCGLIYLIVCRLFVNSVVLQGFFTCVVFWLWYVGCSLVVLCT